MQSIVDQIARSVGMYLPNVLAALAVLVFGWIIVRTVALLLRGALRRTRIDDRFGRWMAGGDEAAKVDWADTIARTIYYILMLVVLVSCFQVLGLSLVTQPISQLLGKLVDIGTQVLGAAILLLIGWTVASLVRIAVLRGFEAIRLDQRLGERFIGGVEDALRANAETASTETAPLDSVDRGRVAADLESVSTHAQPRSARSDLASFESGTGPYIGTTPQASAVLPERSSAEAKGRTPVSRSLADAAYWIVFLLFLPAVLGVLGLESLLLPVQELINEVLAFIPDLITSVLIFVVGWFVARVAQRIVQSLLAAAGADQLGARAGVTRMFGRQTLSGVAGLVVYSVIVIPVLIASLNALRLESIAEPASEMLATILDAIPNIFASGLLLLIAFIVARIVSSLVTNLLAGVGFDSVLFRLGLGSRPSPGHRTPSQIVGYVILVAVLLLSTVEAARLLGFYTIADLVAQLSAFGGRVALGVVLFGVGLFFANLVANAILSSATQQATFLAVVARVAILALTGAIGLRHIGIADDVINLAFGLLLGALAVSAAIAFGWGGHRFAQELIDEWRKKYHEQGRS